MLEHPAAIALPFSDLVSFQRCDLKILVNFGNDLLAMLAACFWLGDLHSPLTAAGLPVRVGTIQCLADEKVVASALMNELHSVQLGRRDAPVFLPTCADFEFSGAAKCIALNYASIHAGP